MGFLVRKMAPRNDAWGHFYVGSAHSAAVESATAAGGAT
jgi:hypothetical protein